MGRGMQSTSTLHEEREREREKEGEDWTEGREGVVVTTSRGGKGTYTNVLSGLVIYECKLHERVDLKIFEITNPIRQV